MMMTTTTRQVLEKKKTEQKAERKEELQGWQWESETEVGKENCLTKYQPNV